MPITPLPDQGIEVPLSEYNRLRAFQGGGWFWDHDNQQVIRRELGDFLPRVEARLDRGNALFQHFVGTTEALSRSQAVGAQMTRVPRAEYQRLQRALENLKLKAQDPRTEPDARKVIEKFRLPDPAKDPELYRLYGSGWNRKLLVLWGCEREEGTSLEPVAALHKVAVESPATTLMRRLLMLLPLLLLLLLLIAAGVWWWRQHEEEQHKAALAENPPAVMNTVPGSSSTAPDASPSSNNPNGPVVAPTGSMAGMTGTNQPGVAPGARVTTVPDDTDSTGEASDTAKTGSSQNAASRDSSAKSSGASSTDGTASGSSATSKQTPSSSAESNRAVVAGATATGAQTPIPSDPTGLPGPTTSPTTGSVNPATAGTAKAGPPLAPPKIVLDAKSGLTPHDGKMDTVLTATAHESDGSLTPLEITRWSVDDRPQQDNAGHDITTGQLRLSLTPGKHHVSVSGKAHGVAVETDTDMDVEIKSQGDVTLKPRANK